MILGRTEQDSVAQNQISHNKHAQTVIVVDPLHQDIFTTYLAVTCCQLAAMLVRKLMMVMVVPPVCNWWEVWSVDTLVTGDWAH